MLGKNVLESFENVSKNSYSAIVFKLLKKNSEEFHFLGKLLTEGENLFIFEKTASKTARKEEDCDQWRKKK